MKFKKIRATFAAALLFLSSVALAGPTTAAADIQEEVYLVPFPRNGDEYYNDKWGHGSHTFMNGWGVGTSRYTTVRAMGSMYSNICYCIEPGVPQTTGDRYAQKGEDFWLNYPSDYNKTISPDDIKLFIGRIMQYGYTGTISTSWRSQNEGGDKLAHAVATQLLIWETVVGERDENFGKVDPGQYDAVLDQIDAQHPLRDRIIAYYRSIEANVQNHTKLPSFLARSASKAQSINLEWNGEKYTATLTDNNNVLSNYSFSAGTSGIRFSVNGNKLTITADEAPSDTVSITAEKKGGQRRGIIIWTDGIYGPDRGLQDIVTYSESVDDPVNGYLRIETSCGSAKIVKTSEDGKVEGISFTITGNGVNKTVKTGPSGEIQIDNLTPGVYTVTEQNYAKYEPQEVRRVTVVSGQVATVNFNNVLKRGDLIVTKTSEDGLNEGVTFHLSGTSLSGIAVDEYAVTDSSGKAYFNDVLIGTGYVLEEVDTAIRYVIPDNQTAAVEWNKVTNKSFHNILKKWNVTVTKSDKEMGTPQGDASLAGAVYGIFKGEQLIDTYTTDRGGQFTTDYYVCGDDWSLREIEPSEGYLLDESAYHIGAEAKNYTVEYNSTANDVTEQIIKGKIALIKHTDNGDTQLETPETGAEFSVFLKSAGSYDAAKDTERDYLICNENGFAETKDLPYGIYTVHQVKGWDGRELLPDFDVYIAKDGQTYRYLANNANFESYIKIIKVDSETGKTIPCAGAGFKLFRPDGSLITQSFTYPSPVTIDTFYTNDEGYLITPEKLEYGSGYSLVEVFAPYGYTLDREPVYFDVTAENATEDNALTVIKVTKPNTAQKGVIKISKSGEVFSSVVESEGIYQPVFSVKGLADAVYEITAAEDIYTLDGTLRYAAGEIVDTVTTDKTGLAESKPLYLGKYEVREITAPDGMVLNGEIHAVELVYAGQNVAVTETETSFYNERQRVEIDLVKSLETDEAYGVGNNSEIFDVTFGLYAEKDLTAADGTVIPADGLIEVITLDGNGHGKAISDLPISNYYVQEISTNAAYLKDDTKYPVVFEYAGQETATVHITANDDEAIENKIINGSVSGKKSNEDGKALGGAVIGIFQTGIEEFTAETAIQTTTSADDGSFSFEKVPYGTWVIREIESPTGFVLSEEEIAVTVGKVGEVVEIELVNYFIKSDIELTKVDADYPDNKLTGAVFGVYADTNGNGEFDKDDELLGEMTELEGGIYQMKELRYGNYFVREKTAPTGFVLDEKVYTVSIEENGKTYVVENEADKGFVNAAQTGSLKIVKTSSDGKLEGFSFRVTGVNGYDKTFTTDKNGEIFIENLRIGEYTVSEVSDGASAAYMPPTDKRTSVFEGAVTTVAMHNELTIVPDTGDTSIWLWAALTGISILGTLAVFRLKKRRKED